MSKSYEIYNYSISTLKTLLSTKSRAAPSVVNKKLHSVYFENYFDHLNATSIIVENNYIDRDYLEDFAGYYVRCFGDYQSTCTRLHFFSIPISKRQFHFLLVGRSSKNTDTKFRDNYLGFIVVKKLPKSIIGRTCLQTYGTDKGRRHYPILRSYQVSLFGIDLEVKRTLAFQEQDSVVAACATSALWTVLQGTGIIFQHEIPSPVRITQLATRIPEEDVPGTFPNHGLTTRQMSFAIRQLGLEPNIIDAENEFTLKATVAAYLSAGIPVLLIIDLVDTSTGASNPIWDRHAVAVTGYSMGLPNTTPVGNTGFSLLSTKIDKLYVHDDQVGPFARMEFNSSSLSISGHGQVGTYSLSTSWKGANGVIGSVHALPYILLAPLYPKIRVSFEAIRKVIVDYDSQLVAQLTPIQAILNTHGISISFDWDITLSTVNLIKSTIRNDSMVPDVTKRRILEQAMPKFIWKASIYSQGTRLCDYLFDATDFDDGDFFVCCVPVHESFNKIQDIVAKQLALNPIAKSLPSWRVVEWISDKH